MNRQLLEQRVYRNHEQGSYEAKVALERAERNMHHNEWRGAVYPSRAEMIKACAEDFLTRHGGRGYTTTVASLNDPDDELIEKMEGKGWLDETDFEPAEISTALKALRKQWG